MICACVPRGRISKDTHNFLILPQQNNNNNSRSSIDIVLHSWYVTYFLSKYSPKIQGTHDDTRRYNPRACQRFNTSALLCSALHRHTHSSPHDFCVFILRYDIFCLIFNVIYQNNIMRQYIQSVRCTFSLSLSCAVLLYTMRLDFVVYLCKSNLLILILID